MTTPLNERSDLDSSPKTTNNNLKDIIDWLRLGDFVVIHNDYKFGRFFHTNCPVSNGEIGKTLENSRVIYVNVKSLAGLLDDGEWEYYIKDNGHRECTCDLKEHVLDPKKLPHIYNFTLGFGNPLRYEP